MTPSPLPFSNPYFLGYLLAFGAAALACLAGARRAQRVTDPDTRRGLVVLLLTSGGWAAVHLGFFLTSTPALKSAFYMATLLVGFMTVWAWLYFCSAYSGRSLHRLPSMWRLAALVYVVVAVVKLTNPYHQLYYTLELTATPFPHLTVRHHLLYWVIMGVSYALAMVGYFMLVELFTQTSQNTRPLLGLTLLTALPAVFNLVGHALPLFLDLTHEPIGVAVFAVGVLYVYEAQFHTVELTRGRDDPALVLSEDNRIRDYNGEAEALFPALADRAAVGRPLPSALPALDDALSSDGLFERRAGGRTRYFRITQNRFGGGRGQLGHVILLADVTERKEYEDELRRAKKAAEEADRLKTAMLANMSHELRTPLTAITGYAEMLKDSLEGQPELFATKIHDGGQRLTNTLDSVLDLSELEAGTRELQREPVDLAGEAEEVLALQRSTADEKNIALRLHRPDVPVRARSNAAAVTRIAQNLIENAIKFTPAGGRIDVRVEAAEDEVVFEVEDTGIGIDDEALPQVFEAFRQESEGMDREYEGTGLGLSIVKELADALDGEIEVETEKDEGTRFVVRLPRAEVEQGRPSARREAAA